MTGPDLSLAAKARFNACAVAVGSLSRLLGGVVVARLLGPELNGQFAFLLWLIESLVLVFSVGLPGALNRFLALNMGQGDEVAARCMMRFSLRAGIVLSLFAALAAYWLAQHFLLGATAATEIAFTLALLVAAQLWSGLAQAILTGLQYFRAYARVVVVSSLILLAGQIVGAMGWGLHGAIYGALASYAVGAVLFLRAVARTRLWKVDLAASELSLGSSVAAYARDAWLAGLITSLIWGRAELFFLDRFSTLHEVGYFAAGLVFSSLLVQAVNLAAGALLPHLAYLVGEGQTERLHNDYRRMTVFIALLAFPLALGGVALMPEIVKLVFGAAYADATPAAQWLMATGLLSFATVGSSVVYGHGDAYIIRNWGIGGVCIIVILCAMIAPSEGAAGVAAVRFFVQASFIAAGFNLLHKRYGMPVPLRQLALLMLASSVCSLMACVASRLSGGGILGMAVGVLCGTLTYAIMLRILRPINFGDLAAIYNLLAKMPLALRTPTAFMLSMICPR